VVLETKRKDGPSQNYYALRAVLKFCRISGSHSGRYEEFYPLGYNTVYSVESQPTFRRNMLPPSSKLNKSSKKLPWKQVTSRCFHAGFLLGLFDPEDWRDMFLRNVGWLSTHYTALYVFISELIQSDSKLLSGFPWPVIFKLEITK
jgi:hypothetical protein